MIEIDKIADFTSLTMDERKQIINQIKTKKGGYSKAGLESIGISYPPPKGWRQLFIRNGVLAKNVKGTLIAATEAIYKKAPIKVDNEIFYIRKVTHSIDTERQVCEIKIIGNCITRKTTTVWRGEVEVNYTNDFITDNFVGVDMIAEMAINKLTASYYDWVARTTRARG